MARHHDKLIARALGVPPEPPRQVAPMTHGQIESFVKGFDLSAAAVRQIVAKWSGDASCNYREGYDQGYQEAQWDS